MDTTGRQELEAGLLSVEDGRFLLGFLVFAFPFTIPSDAPTYAVDSFGALHLKGPDGYIKNSFAFWKKDPNRATVDSPRSNLCLLDDFHGRDFWCACDRPTREEGLEGLD